MFAQVIQSIVMVAIGYNYTWLYHNGREEGGNLCPNGAAWWLWIAGISHLIFPLLVVWDALSKCLPNSNKETPSETLVVRMCIKVSDFFSLVFLVVNYIAIPIWGSIVVFGAWANRTDDFDAYKANPEELNFCAHTPMMTAFVILILKWVIWP